MNELKKIDGFPYYYISDNGKVFSFKTYKWLKPFLNKGYYHISLMHDGKRKSVPIHRCVLNTFKGHNIDKYCNHIDGNKLNNNISNLEWVSPKQNTIHAAKLGLLNITNKKRIRLINIQGHKVNYVFNSILEASQIFGVHDYSIHRVLNGKRKRVKGMIFKRID